MSDQLIFGIFSIHFFVPFVGFRSPSGAFMIQFRWFPIVEDPQP